MCVVCGEEITNLSFWGTCAQEKMLYSIGLLGITYLRLYTYFLIKTIIFYITLNN